MNGLPSLESLLLLRPVVIARRLLRALGRINRFSDELLLLRRENAMIADERKLLVKEVARLEKENRRLETEGIRLKDRISKNSRNSSRPPSSDMFRPKPKSIRDLLRKKKRTTGGQPGHKGHTLLPLPPDHVVEHKVTRCEGCHTDLTATSVLRTENRQVHDIPEPKISVTEHRAEVKQCRCGRITRAMFPEGVNAPVQYGPYIQAASVFLNVGQGLPEHRSGETLSSLVNAPVSNATLEKSVAKAVVLAAGPMEKVRQMIIQADVVHFDESGLRVDGKNRWLHTASTTNLTYYTVHDKRGTEAMDAAGILPEFGGNATHDGLKSYFSYTDCTHSLCNSHHLRELVFIWEQYNQNWAEEMIRHLIEIKDRVDAARAAGETKLTKNAVGRFRNRYHEILLDGFDANPDEWDPVQKKALNLLKRLEKYEDEVLRFVKNFSVPFDNNLAERDIRMIKTKIKVSGCFRTVRGAERFASIRGYISTAVKNGLAPFDALVRLFTGNPFVPTINSA